MKQNQRPRTRKLSDEQINHWYHYNLDLVSRTLYFGPWHSAGDLLSQDEERVWCVDDFSCQNLIKGLHALEQEGQDPIIINWFSYGGDWDAGMAMYDYIKTCSSYVTIRCFGRVRSMGTIVLQAADERLLSKNCLFLLHYGTAASSETHAKDFEMYAEELKKSNSIMEDIYLESIREKKPRFSRERLQELIRFDKYLKPEEVIEIGLADGIIA